MHLDSGFILSTETVDSPLGVSFVIWLLTEKGPLKAISLPESVVFFIKLKDKATVENISDAVLNFFQQPKQVVGLQERFTAIHKSLQYGGSETAAKALVKLIEAG